LRRGNRNSDGDFDLVMIALSTYNHSSIFSRDRGRSGP
jgi:hypothetical protein